MLIADSMSDRLQSIQRSTCAAITHQDLRVRGVIWVHFLELKDITKSTLVLL